MQTSEINGFLIDDFNQYGLAEGKPQGTCPLCSSDRQPKNQKAQCASYDWERGLGTCHNCNNSFQLHTYQRKGASEKIYIRPDVPLTKQEVSTKVEEWFATRGITQKTLKDLKIGEGPEYMPQTGKTENVIKFNYFIGDQLINVKYRDGRKNFKLYKGAEKVFYNINSIIGYDQCVIVEGEMDVLALHEAGIPNSISVPNGATLNSNNLDYLDTCIDYFEDKERIILAVDADEAGQALQQELVRRLGAEVCFLASFDDCKDANEYLTKHGKEKLAECITGARPVHLKTLRRLKTSKVKLRTLFAMVLNQDFKLVYRILTTSFQLTLVNLLLSLVFLVAVNRILSIKWLSDTTKTMVGKRHLLHLKMHRLIYTHIK